jgi:hypothetical protein
MMERWIKNGLLNLVPRDWTVKVLEDRGLKIQHHREDVPIIQVRRDRQIEIHCDMTSDLRASQMADLIEALNATDIRIYASSHDPYDDSPFRTCATIYVPECFMDELCHGLDDSDKILAERATTRQQSNKQHAIEIAKRAGLTPEDLA